VIICLCEGVSDREVKALVGNGVRNVAAVGRICGAGQNCGQCTKSIQRLLNASGAREGTQRDLGATHCQGEERALD